MDGKLKPWQIVLFVAALGAVGFAVYSASNRQLTPSVASSITLVDVSTGELFEASTKRKSVMLPAKNPETGKYALLPVSKDDSGSWTMERKFLDALSYLDKGIEPTKVDAKSGKVDVVSGSPRKIN